MVLKICRGCRRLLSLRLTRGRSQKIHTVGQCCAAHFGLEQSACEPRGE